MLPSITQATVVSSIKHSPQENNAISPRLELIEKKLSAISCDKRTIETNQFADFIKDNKSKIIAFSVNDERPSALLVKATSLLNAISDNNEIGLDNAENYNKLSMLKGECEALFHKDNPNKSVERRIKDEVTRSAEKIGKEVERSSDRVGKEVERSVSKVGKEAKRILKRF